MLEMLNLQPQETRTSLLLTQLSRFSTVRNLTLIFNCNINELIKKFSKIFFTKNLFEIFFRFFLTKFFFLIFFQQIFFFFLKFIFGKFFRNFFFEKNFCAKIFLYHKNIFFRFFWEIFRKFGLLYVWQIVNCKFILQVFSNEFVFNHFMRLSFMLCLCLTGVPYILCATNIQYQMVGWGTPVTQSMADARPDNMPEHNQPKLMAPPAPPK